MKRDALINHYKLKISQSRGSTQDLYVKILGALLKEGSTADTIQHWATDQRLEAEAAVSLYKSFYYSLDLLED